MCTSICVDICFQFSWYISKSTIAGLYGSSIFNFFRNCQIVFQNSWPTLHSHQQCMRAAISPHPSQHLLWSLFYYVILLDMKCYLFVVLICISLTPNDVEHFVMYWLTICMSSLENCLFRLFTHLNWVICLIVDL